MNHPDGAQEIDSTLSVLILDSGRQTLPFLKAYSRAGYDTTVVCSTRLNECYLSRYPSRRVIWPAPTVDRNGFETRLFDYLKANRPDVTIGVSDVTSEILSHLKQKIQAYTRVTVPDYPIFNRTADKLTLMEHCMAHGLPCPKTYALTHDILPDIDELLGFPVIVKPTRGVGALGVIRYDSAQNLCADYARMAGKYDRLLVQEYIPQKGGMQYQAEAFLDDSSRMRVCMTILKPRFFPVRGGTSTANVTIDHPEIVDTTRRLLEGLHWRGAADVDYVLDPRDNTPKILEVNPRVTAGIKIGFMAGIDFADLHIKLALGQAIPAIPHYRLDVYCRNIIMDLLWYVSADKTMRRNTSPPFFRFFGADVGDQVFSCADPLAGVGFLAHMLIKYLNVSRFRAKFLR